MSAVFASLWEGEQFGLNYPRTSQDRGTCLRAARLTADQSHLCEPAVPRVVRPCGGPQLSAACSPASSLLSLFVSRILFRRSRQPLAGATSRTAWPGCSSGWPRSRLTAALAILVANRAR